MGTLWEDGKEGGPREVAWGSVAMHGSGETEDKEVRKGGSQTSRRTKSLERGANPMLHPAETLGTTGTGEGP